MCVSTDRGLSYWLIQDKVVFIELRFSVCQCQSSLSFPSFVLKKRFCSASSHVKGVGIICGTFQQESIPKPLLITRMPTNNEYKVAWSTHHVAYSECLSIGYQSEDRHFSEYTWWVEKHQIAHSLPGILFCRYTTVYALFVGILVIYKVFGTDSCWNVPQIIPTHVKGHIIASNVVIRRPIFSRTRC
jgi:hypothetical protein